MNDLEITFEFNILMQE